ncbi:hypothetical protein M422DRAFT_77461, partial [Sphaerobolus stellatus SS14]
RFRVLILGRANAGKTMILERLTGVSAGEAEIWRNGWRLEGQVCYTKFRGLHHVQDEITYPSRPGFIFHDSPGFEAGSAEELVTVRQFVKNSSTATDIKKQLHAIW